MCANEYVYLGKLYAQINHILLKMCANVLPPIKQVCGQYGSRGDDNKNARIIAPNNNL